MDPRLGEVGVALGPVLVDGRVRGGHIGPQHTERLPPVHAVQPSRVSAVSLGARRCAHLVEGDRERHVDGLVEQGDVESARSTTALAFPPRGRRARWRAPERRPAERRQRRRPPRRRACRKVLLFRMVGTPTGDMEPPAPRQWGTSTGADGLDPGNNCAPRVNRQQPEVEFTPKGGFRAAFESAIPCPRCSPPSPDPPRHERCRPTLGSAPGSA